MIKVESGIMVPLAEPFPNLAPGLPGETGIDDEASSTAIWVNQCIEAGSLALDPGLDLESLFGSLASGNFSADADLMDADPTNQPGETTGGTVERPAQPVTPISVPASPASSDSSYHHSTNPVPRHKRPSHKRAELKRRDKIKNRLDDLKAEVPSIAEKGKMSESAILTKAAEYAKHLKGECERFTTEAGNLRREIESLSSEIHTFQEHLPATGLKPEGSEGGSRPLDQLYNDYVAQRTKASWKFYLYSFFMKPMFKSYKEETSTSSLSAFMTSVANWTRDSLGLSNLRPQSLEIMREICKETDIMNHPESLPQQALASVSKPSASAKATQCTRPPASTQPEVFTKPVPVAQRPSAPPQETRVSHRHRDRSPKVRATSPRNRLPPAAKPGPSGEVVSVSPPRHFIPVMPSQAPSQTPLASIFSTPAKNIATPEVAMLLPGQQSGSTVSAVPTSAKFSVAGRPTPYQQTVRAQPTPDVGQTSLQQAVSTASLPPNMVVVPGRLDTKVARFTISGSAGTNNCHFYDFDITDIPLPELPDSVLPSPQPSFTTASPFTCLTTIEAYPLLSAGGMLTSFAQGGATILTSSHSAVGAQSTTTVASTTTPSASSSHS